VGLAAALVLSCAPARPPPPAAPPRDVAAETAAAEEALLEKREPEVLGILADADPRMALRAHSEGAVHAVGVFAFDARAAVLEQAAAMLAPLDALPERAAPGHALARPRLERELLSRLVEEERARAADEAPLGAASGDLVRGLAATWTPPDPDVPRVWEERDVEVSGELRAIGESLRGLPRTGPVDLDPALNGLERLLVPAKYPKSAAAVAELRVALDQDMRAIPPLQTPERIAHGVKVHLGVDLDPSSLPARLEPIARRLRADVAAWLDGHAAERASLEGRARGLLFADATCPSAGTRVGALAPPPERAKVCGVLRALAPEQDPHAAILAIHDEILLALAAVTTSPPPRTRLLSRPDDDAVDAFRREATLRPVPFVAVLLAAEILFAQGADPDPRVRAWSTLGDAPLDVVARELSRHALAGDLP
jgi:hypothetical protein